MQQFIQREASAIGESTHQFVQAILTADSWQQRRKAAAVLRLATHFSPAALEVGCQMMLQTHQVNYKRLKEFLGQHQISTMGKDAPQSPLRSSLHLRFLRDPNEFKAFAYKLGSLLTTTIKELLPL